MINIRMKGHFVRNFSSFKAGLPISSAPSFLHLRFSFRLPSCAFWNYIYLLTYTSMLDRQTDERADTSRQRVSRTISRAKNGNRTFNRPINSAIVSTIPLKTRRNLSATSWCHCDHVTFTSVAPSVVRRVRSSLVRAAYARSFVETTVLFVASLTLRCSCAGGCSVFNLSAQLQISHDREAANALCLVANIEDTRAE